MANIEMARIQPFSVRPKRIPLSGISMTTRKANKQTAHWIVINTPCDDDFRALAKIALAAIICRIRRNAARTKVQNIASVRPLALFRNHWWRLANAS